ncbi:myb-binding protein 1A [Phacochoerus africanus]|uniref:myb-binding protein 1A n=1 Tax=Phacochoerus africanus TaxID=41426 RepID=UPI001FD88048|nr:myb-binding protein 1A [Phacochoerus africanus]
MAETESMDVAEPVSPVEVPKTGAGPADRHGLLKHSREFLDFFWDIAKPQQETRLEATEKLLEYLRARPKGSSEMKYALKRLITGLGVGRETARPCYSLALAQLLQSFEDIPLCSILQQIQEKYNLQKVKKGMMRPALFANLFGVLALFQSGRLVKDSEVLMKSVKLLQVLAQHYNHLQEQPQKALVDILSEVPEAVLQEVLPKVLKTELSSVLGSPEHLELFLLAQQKVPKKLEKLMGPVNLFSDENIPRLVTVLKMAATSVKKERKLPAVALDLLRLALQEDKFPWFWKEVVEQGLLKKQFWPASYLCFRLLGAALPLLSKEQLQLVMRGDLIRHYGEHTVTAKLPNHYKFAPEMNQYVEAFLEGCRDDAERQLAMVVAFTSVTNQGLPVMPTFWRVVKLLSPPALQGYVAWLRDMFLQPDLDALVDFSTNNQKKTQDASLHGPERAVFRLRKWIILRLVSIVDCLHAEKEEALTEEVARFCFFHSFFETKKPTSQIPETEQHFSPALESRTREVVSGAFFSLLQTLSTQFRQAPEQAQDRQPWTYRLVQFADMLLSHSRNVVPLTPFTTQQRQAWDRMLKTLKELETHSSEAKAKATAFQHLLLLVGIHLFKSPAESCDLLGDIQTCIKKSLGEKTRRTRSKATNPQELPWVEVLVEILLSLLAQPSHLMRQVARSVFSHICSHLTPRALQLILDVLNPEESQDEDDNVVVTDDSKEEPLGEAEDKSSDDEDNKGDKNSESEEESDGEESDEADRDGDVDQGFREQLMAVLQAGKALGGGDGEDDDDEELGDEAMMALDENLASLFAEQKLRIQARREEKNKLQKEKALRRDFQIRVLDLIEVLVTKQPENPLVLELLEPLLHIIRRSMRTSSAKQEQDLLHKTARIFTHHLCRSRHYCRDVGDRVETVYAQLERLVRQAGQQADSSVALYHFNASLYLLRVLKGSTMDKSAQKEEKTTAADASAQGGEAATCLDLSRVTPIYSAVLSSFLTKRNSPLTVPMFLSLFCRHPMLCKNLLPLVVEHVASHGRPRHQAQACLLLQKSLHTRELRLCFKAPEWEQLMAQILAKVTENLRTLGEAETKSEHQKELSSLELLNTLFRNIRQEKLTTDLSAVLGVLQSQQPRLQQKLQQEEHSTGTGSSRLHDLYWQAMKLLGVQRPKSEKDAKEAPEATQNPVSMKRKKKGFLPETKKRKKRKSEGAVQGEGAAPAATGGDQPPSTGKKRRNKRKAKVPAQSQVNGMPAAKSPAPDSPAQPPKPRKRKRKQSQVNGTPATKSPAPDSPAQTEKPQKQNEKQSQVNVTPAIESPAPDLSAQTPKPQKKNPKLSQVNGTPATRSPAPDPPTQTPKLQKKNQKLSQANAMPATKSPAPGPPAASPTASAQTPKLQKKNRKLSQVTVTPATKSPVSDLPTISPGPPAQTPKLQKKNQKLSQMKGATPESLDSPEEPAAKKRPKKNLPQKGISGKSPQSALPRKKARLSLASRSPSLLQSGARKKVQPRKVKKL